MKQSEHPEGGRGNNPPESGTRRLLVVEDDPLTQKMLRVTLTAEGFAVDVASDGQEALHALEKQLYDVVLLDLNLPRVSGMAVLAAAPALQTDAQFIVLSGEDSVELAVEAMKSGAFDYIAKPCSTVELLLVIRRALDASDLGREVAALRRQVGLDPRSRIIGRSPAIERMFDLIERVAPMRANVLLVGETGTGKEQVARAIHDLSTRSRKPFVPVHAAALPESLLEGELFGSMKGSFTGATENRRGVIEHANGGTLFLDELATISPMTQVKLLRVLQERTVQRIGAQEAIAVDFRLVAATNVDLKEEVAAGRFREDLYYRVNVFPIVVPPLRERAGDVILLAGYFLERFASEHGIPVPTLAPDAARRMQAYEWPGNVRELENFIERSVILHAGRGQIPFDLDAPPSAGREALFRDAEELEWTLADIEREQILRVLARVNGNQVRAAEILGIARRTLYRKLKEYDPGRLDVRQPDGPPD